DVYFSLLSCFFLFLCFFFFQAEDGIRDLIVTGVQTCALPIWFLYINAPDLFRKRPIQKNLTLKQLLLIHLRSGHVPEAPTSKPRSEERRVGKECRSRWSQYP